MSGESTPPRKAIVVESRPSETAHAVSAAVGCTLEQATNGTCNVDSNGEPQVLVAIVNPGTNTLLINGVAVYIYQTYPIPKSVFVAMAYPTSVGANQLTTPTVDPVTDNQMVKRIWANIIKVGKLPPEVKHHITFAPVQFNIPRSSSSSSSYFFHIFKNLFSD